MTPHEDRRPNDPLDLEALPGQRRPLDDDDDGVGEPRKPDTKGRGRDESDKLDQYLLRRYHLYGDRKAREQLITMYLPLVRSLARRYASRGEPFDDLVQVGAIGLIKAIDRFDLERGVELTTYATPNIVGEIKRYFRDKGWSVRVPARPAGAQHPPQQGDRRARARAAALAHDPGARRGRQRDAEEVLEALETSQAYNSVSLQASPNGEGGRRTPAHRLPGKRRRGLRHHGGPRRRSRRASRSSTSASATSSTCASSRASRRVRSPSASASRRCTSRASSAARSRSCARRSATSTTPTPRCSPVAGSSGAGRRKVLRRTPITVKTDREG